jgi:hypothetical protein
MKLIKTILNPFFQEDRNSVTLIEKGDPKIFSSAILISLYTFQDLLAYTKFVPFLLFFDT